MKKLIKHILKEDVEKKFMSKLPDIIKNKFPQVKKVYFTEKPTYLGSSSELPEEERTIQVNVINIVIDNEEGNLLRTQVMWIKSEILDYLENIGIDLWSYGSKWGTSFRVLQTMSID